jgi:hypothetical protein
MIRDLLAAARIIAAAFLAYIAAGATVWWLGDAWWSVMLATSAAVAIYLPVAGLEVRRARS